MIVLIIPCHGYARLSIVISYLLWRVGVGHSNSSTNVMSYLKHLSCQELRIRSLIRTCLYNNANCIRLPHTKAVGQVHMYYRVGQEQERTYQFFISS